MAKYKTLKAVSPDGQVYTIHTKVDYRYMSFALTPKGAEVIDWVEGKRMVAWQFARPVWYKVAPHKTMAAAQKRTQGADFKVVELVEV